MIRIALFASLIVFTLAVMGQTLVPGYIITHEKDTLQVQILQQKSFSNGIFIKDGVRTEYSATEVAGWGIAGDAFFSSQIISGEFVEVLVAGTITLFKTSNNTMYIQKAGYEYIPLEKEVFVATEGNMKGTYKSSNNWEGILRYWIGDCNKTIAKGEFKRNERFMTKLITTYNKCVDENFIEYKNDKPWVKVEWMVTGGISMININLYPYDFTGPWYLTSTMPDKVKGYGPMAGFGVGFFSPRLSDKLSLNFELGMRRFNTVTYKKIEREFISSLYELEVYNKTYTISSDVKYTLFRGPIPLNLHGGVVWMKTTEDINLFSDRYYTEGVIIRDRYGFEGITLSLPTVHPFVGISTHAKLGTFKIGAGLFFDYTSTMNYIYFGKNGYFNFKLSLRK
jgi:hypothetical protein